MDLFGTFAASPEVSGMLYQWNRSKAWSTTDESVAEWDPSTPTGDSWEASNDPCPAGWRLPTKKEQEKLLDTDKVSSEWVTLNGVRGRKFTDKATGGSIFLPAAGFRYLNAGLSDGEGSFGQYWSSSPNTSYYAWSLFITSSNIGQSSVNRQSGYSIRCVLQ